MNRLTGAASATVRAAVTEILNGDDVGAHNALGDLEVGDRQIAVEAIEKLARIGRDMLNARHKATALERRETMRLVYPVSACCGGPSA